MMRVLKNTGNVTSSAVEKATKSDKGRVELCVYDTLETDANGKKYELDFTEYGNYGRVRWQTNVLLSEAEVKDMQSLLCQVLSGKLVETLEHPTETPVVETTEQTTETVSTEKDGE